MVTGGVVSQVGPVGLSPVHQSFEQREHKDELEAKPDECREVKVERAVLAGDPADSLGIAIAH